MLGHRQVPRPAAARARTGDPVASPPGTGWQQRYARAVRCSDALAITAATVVGVGTGLDGHDAVAARMAWGAAAALLSVAGLAASRAWEPRVLGNGAEEYRRVFRSFGGAAVALGLVGLALHVLSVRAWVFGFVPLAGVLCVLGRQGLRSVLHRARDRRLCMRRVLAVGDDAGITDLVRRTRRDPGFGWQVAVVCTPTAIGPDGDPELAAVPVVGDLDEVAAAALEHRIDVVTVMPAPGWGPRRLQQLAWDLEGSGIELAVAPTLTEIAGPRLHVAPIDGMPLLRLSKPRVSGGMRLIKGATDRVGALLLVVALAPVLLALAVRRGRGPVFERRDRVGQRGRPFRMITFHVRPESAAELRWHSLAGLPRLVNVLAGSMSLIGPRPLSPLEVSTFGEDAWGRLLIKPGMLVAAEFGPDDMSWDESARLSLRYVEHWSATSDISILWRTLRAWTLQAWARRHRRRH